MADVNINDNSQDVENYHLDIELGDVKEISKSINEEKKAAASPTDGCAPDRFAGIQLWSVDELQNKLETKFDVHRPEKSFGLTSEEAQKRRELHGENRLTGVKPRPEWQKYLLKYTDPFMLALNGAGILSVVAYLLDKSQPINLWLGIVLFVVTIISTTFAYVEEGKSSAVMSSFRNLLPRKCHVLRDGHEQIVEAWGLVVGDVVRVGTGDNCPADLRLFSCTDLKVENSALTGESLPISCTIDSTEKVAVEAHNLVWSGSQCLEGEAFGVVYAIGDNSMIGNIAQLTAVTTNVDTTLQKEIKHVVSVISKFSIAQSIIFFTIGMSRQQPWISTFINSFIVVMVANVPQGLPSTVVSCLTIIAKRLSEQNVYIKQLQSVETLGSATVIATDKTGTLTMNKMSVSRFWFDLATVPSSFINMELPSYKVRTRLRDHKTNTAAKIHTIAHLELVAAICNRTRFEDEKELEQKEAETLAELQNVNPATTMTVRKKQLFVKLQDDALRPIVGEGADRALFEFAAGRQSIELARYMYDKLLDVPFNSTMKFAVTVILPKGSNRPCLLMKGAPEIVLAKCSHYMLQGQPEPVDQKFRSSFDFAYKSMACDGERVLGFAMMELGEEYIRSSDDKLKFEDLPTSGLEFLGLISLVDPPKPSVPKAVEEVRGAGVKVIMVTGDHPFTAAAIARQVNILKEQTREEIAEEQQIDPKDVDENEVQAVVVTGSQLLHFQQDDWDRVLLKKEVIFARTSPQQKLQIVENLQRLKHVVAATGDGVNDAPALKKADIGVAMGKSGSDVARDAADVILLDDDFSSIVTGVREGRVLFDNLTKTIAYTLSHLWPEVVPVLLNLAFGFPLALGSIQILLIDLGTELAPAISLAYEKAESNVMRRPPRNADTDRLVSVKVLSYSYLQAGIIETAFCFMGFFLVFDYYGIPSSSLYLAADNYFGMDADDFIVNGRVFDSDRQAEILTEAQTCYWMLIVGVQFFHIFLCKTRLASVFRHGLLSNMVLNYGVFVEAGLIVLIIFVPWANSFVGTRPFPAIFWLVLIIPVAVLVIWSEGTKAWIRNHKQGKFAKFFGW